MKDNAFPQISCLVLGLFCSLLCYPARSQGSEVFPAIVSPSPNPPVEDEIEQLIRRRERLEAEYEQLEAEYNVLRKQRELLQLRGPVLPNTTEATRPLAPSTTDVQEGGQSSVEARILIYEAMDKVAAAVYEDIREVQGIDALVVYSDDVFASIPVYRLLKVKMKEFERRYAQHDINLRQRPSVSTRGGTRGLTDLTPLSLPTQFTRSILEFVALFRSEDNITLENDFRPSANALVAAVAAHIQANQSHIKVYNPDLQAMPIGTVYANIDSIIGPQLANLIRLRTLAAQRNDRRLSPLNQEVDAFTAEIFGSHHDEPRSTDQTMLRQIMQANQLESILETAGAHILHLDVDVSGGSRRTRRSLFTSILSGSRLSFSGGVVISYNLLAQDGSLKKSNFFYYNTGYKGFKGKKTNIHKKLR